MRIKRILIQFFVIMLVFSMAAGAAAQALLGERVLRKGMTGEDVAMLQEFLNNNGFWAGPIDGIFGPLTFEAVVAFQKQHDLAADGIVGPETAEIINRSLTDGPAVQAAVLTVAAAVTPEPELSFSEEELDLLARLVQAEAGGESFEGQVAVAATVLNRLRSDLYPNTLFEVIYQVVNGCYQYSPVQDGRINLPAGESAIRAVQEAIRGVDPTGGATGFYNPSKTANAWVRTRPVLAVIGGHVFFN